MSIFNRNSKTDAEMVEQEKERKRRQRCYENPLKNLNAQLMFQKMIDLYGLTKRSKDECSFLKYKIISSAINRKKISKETANRYTTEFFMALKKFRHYLGRDEACVYCRGVGKNFYWVLNPEVNKRFENATFLAVSDVQSSRKSRSDGIIFQGRIMRNSKLGKFEITGPKYDELSASEQTEEQLLKLRAKAEQYIV